MTTDASSPNALDPPPDSGQVRAPHWQRTAQALSGGVLAMLAWLIYAEMVRGVIPYIGNASTMVVLTVLGAWAGTGRLRKWIWAFAAFAVFLRLFAGFSPLVPWGIRGLLRADPLEKAPAVVVLAAGVNRHGAINAVGRARLDRGFEILGEGYAPTLVLTRAVGHHNNWVPLVKERLRKFGLTHRIESVGPVVNTHDEAVLVAALARAKGWSQIILVTHPWHMRRSAAVFEKQGLRVIASPCEEIEYDPLNIPLGGPRVKAFQDWIHEVGALVEYRAKGWVD